MDETTDEEKDKEEEEEEDVDDDIVYLMKIEEKIKEMKLEWAQANESDAAFIEDKIRDMEEFLADAKKELGIAEDTEMKDATKNKKRGRGEVGGDGDGDGEAVGGDDGENAGFLARFKRN